MTEPDELHDRYIALLIDRVCEPRYPSAAMMDRAERSIRDRDQATTYVEALLDKVEQDRYPSPAMLDRIARLLGAP